MRLWEMQLLACLHLTSFKIVVDEDCIEMSYFQSVVNIPRDFEGSSTLRKYCGQLQFLQSRVPMAAGQEAAVPVTW